jgi:hypothetical protein
MMCTVGKEDEGGGAEEEEEEEEEEDAEGFRVRWCPHGRVL